MCSHVRNTPAELRELWCRNQFYVRPDVSLSHQSGETRVQSRRGDEFESSSTVELGDETHLGQLVASLDEK